jgi:hypothetical protein
MTADDFKWSAPPLTSEEDELIREYLANGTPVDALPYTGEFDALVQRLRLEPDEANKRLIFRKLLSLRKRGVLPRIYASASSSGD